MISRIRLTRVPASGWPLVALGLVLAVSTLQAQPPAAKRHALIVIGASGGDEYRAKYEGWRDSLLAALRERFGYDDPALTVLADGAPGAQNATRENVRAAFTSLSQKVRPDDLLLIVLMGHGTTMDGDDAKFNLVGPDLTADEWAKLVAAVPGRLVFVNTTSGSFPFLGKMSARGRVVMTATDTAAQQYETVFAGYLIASLSDAAADGDKNGRVSMWEAFRYASARVRDSFEERGQLATERPLLDDNGDGIGREAEAVEGPADAPAGSDGALARVTYLQGDPPLPAGADMELRKLLTRRAEINARVDLLRSSKAAMKLQEYDEQLEEALLELARIDAQVRARSQPAAR
jgi:hypothetical protein